ncbi:hypothetical protein NSQ20_11820 [Paenibacillus sp. FSL K6-1122]|uniref:hypothetical protein n=1 Tax=Paenibacillus sp. FSL K6-1122 TaxID=2954512 RepID=UPI0030EE3534
MYAFEVAAKYVVGTLIGFVIIFFLHRFLEKKKLIKKLKAEGREIVYIKFKMDNKVRTGIIVNTDKEGGYRVLSNGQIRVVEQDKVIID